jgi:phosphatidylserine/phosphatidylglycerophosphate/cardiolipin synthase-like enzyme
MGLFNLIISKLQTRKKNNEESTIQALRKEIEDLRRENKAIKEKIILFPQKNNQEIHLEFFDKNIEATIVENICKAKKELCIAMAWFTSNAIREELRNLKRRGVIIKVVISDAKENYKYENINKLRDACDELKIAVILKTTDKGTDKYLMHNKYCIIDNKKVIDGSYNWSYRAKNNEEHIVVIESTTVAAMFKNNFDKIYNNPEYYVVSSTNYKLG